ncbi:Uncharacterised protein [uncultured archaeon]|nr:Uncharacterised protein [uncultured archaeon]
MINKLRRGKSTLESMQAANNRKILINLGSAHTVIDRFIQKTGDPGDLIDLKKRLTILSSELFNKDRMQFNVKVVTMDDWNSAEKAVIDSSEKLAIELERQLTAGLDIAAIEGYTDAVSNAILNRLQVTPELNAHYGKILKNKKSELKVNDGVSLEFDNYLNSLLAKYANFNPGALHMGGNPDNVKWEYTSGSKSVTATMTLRGGTSLVFETRWEDETDLAGLVKKEIASVKKNEYKCLCLVNRSWDGGSRDFARRFEYPKMSLYLHDLKEGFYYNNSNASAVHYKSWFSTELKKKA